jgi:hypothetical protein
MANGDFFDSAGPLLYLFTLLQQLQGPTGTLLQSVEIGAPSNLQDRVSAFVALGEQNVKDFTMTIMARDSAYYVGFGYRVDPNQAQAELTLAAILDAFLTAIYSDRTLGGTVNSDTLVDLSLTKTPQYQKVAQQEYRIYACLVHVRQYQAR